MSNRELDAEVAEKVMGWTYQNTTPSGNRIYDDEEGGRVVVGESAMVSIWSPSTQIAAAMEVS